MPFARYCCLRCSSMAIAWATASPMGVMPDATSVGGVKPSAVVKSHWMMTSSPNVTMAISARFEVMLSAEISSLSDCSP